MTELADQKKLRIIIADDHELIRDGICGLLALESDMEVVATVEDGETAVQKAEELRPDVVVMDIRMPRLNGIEATKKIRSRQSGTLVLCMSVHHEKIIVDSVMEAGASGYILKGNVSTDLSPAIRAIVAGEVYFCSSVQE
jgi:two-component system response regulator NreC